MTARSESSHPDARWRWFMARGNAAFSAGELDDALAFYRDGLAEAEQLLHRAAMGAGEPGSDPAPMLVVTAFNVSNVHEDRNQNEQARKALQKATSLLRATMNDDNAPPDLRMNCLQHINRALTQLIQHMQRTNADQKAIAREVEAIKEAANKCLAAMKPNLLH